jgi:hypothetical protein
MAPAFEPGNGTGYSLTIPLAALDGDVGVADGVVVFVGVAVVVGVSVYDGVGEAVGVSVAVAVAAGGM